MHIINDYFTCDKTDCHGNKDGLCHALRAPIKGKPCPFYKSKLRLVRELMLLEDRPIDWERYRQLAKDEGRDNAD